MTYSCLNLTYRIFYINLEPAECLKWTCPIFETVLCQHLELSIVNFGNIKMKIQSTNSIDSGQTVIEAGLALYWWQRLFLFQVGKRDRLVACEVILFLYP